MALSVVVACVVLQDGGQPSVRSRGTMATVLDKLTSEHRTLLPKCRELWLGSALSTEIADRPTAEKALGRAYEAAGSCGPTSVVWLRSPLAGSIAAAMLTGFIGADRPWTPAVRHLVRGELSQFVDNMWETLSREVPRELWERLSKRTGTQVLWPLHPGWDALQSQVGPLAEIMRALEGADLALRSFEDVVFRQTEALAEAQLGSPHAWRPARLPDEAHSRFWNQVNLCSKPHLQLAVYACLEWLGVPLTSGLREQLQLSRSCGWCWSFEQLALLTERPGAVNVDDRGWLHSDAGPAISYGDGFELFSWHGVAGLPPNTITSPECLTLEAIEAQPELGVRRVMVERFGARRYRDESARERPRLRWVTFEPLPGVGGGHLPRKTQRLDDFLLAIPYLLMPRYSVIPPLHVLNELLRSGGWDAGMSGGSRWDPFEIHEADYAQLVQVLTRAGYRIPPEAPDWVNSYPDWQTWLHGQERKARRQSHQS